MTDPSRGRDRVLVTGAGGKTGRAVLAAVLARGGRVRALIRDPDRHADLVERADRTGAGDGSSDGSSDVEVVRGDQRDVADLVSALDGCAAVYAIAPNVSPHERAMAAAVIEACGRAGVERVVFHSVVHPQLSAMPHHADKAAAEALVVESGRRWTILQPNAYLQNLATYADRLRAGRYEVPYATDRGLALVDLRDVAEVAARCLVDHLGVHATFELSGPAEVPGMDIAALAGEVLDREVIAVRQSPDTWATANARLPDEVRRRLTAMFAHYDAHGSPGDATVLRALLGREPGDLRSYLGALLA